MIMFSFAIIIDEEGSQEVKDFLNAVNKDVIREKYLLPPIKPYDTPYSIVSNALIKRTLFKLLLPAPIKTFVTVYRSLAYIKEAFSSLIKRTAKHGDLGRQCNSHIGIYQTVRYGKLYNVYAGTG